VRSSVNMADKTREKKRATEFAAKPAKRSRSKKLDSSECDDPVVLPSEDECRSEDINTEIFLNETEAVRDTINKIIHYHPDSPSIVMGIFCNHIESIGYGKIDSITEGLINAVHVFETLIGNAPKKLQHLARSFALSLFGMMFLADETARIKLQSFFKPEDGEYQFFDYCVAMTEMTFLSSFHFGNSEDVLWHFRTSIAANWDHSAIKIVNTDMVPEVVKLGPPGV
jgi:hypothetical protein